ncbi:hypothetical protein HU200_019326 [Digitaria exilis]|uniref:Uncharacterized protein n=1 Tax=Digitaria exilis TaxID=1010633 RepID=A0A835F306_9POAL|nr:hypothetical protein HU200_019326 [Digitaria exilis]
MLVSWRLWKRRNACVFRDATPDIAEVMEELLEEASLWAQAGATSLGAVGWPVRVSAGPPIV